MEHAAFFKWDWKEDAPLDLISDAVERLSGGIRIVEVDTGSDYRAVFVVSPEVSDETIDAMWAGMRGR